MKLGEFIKNYRAEKDISQRQFAAQCQVSNGYISILEDGKRPKSGAPVVPTITTLKKIAAAMGMTLHELINIVDDMPIAIAAPQPPPEQKEKTAPEDGLSDAKRQLIALAHSVSEEKAELALRVLRSLLEDGG